MNKNKVTSAFETSNLINDMINVPRRFHFVVDQIHHQLGIGFHNNNHAILVNTNFTDVEWL